MRSAKELKLLARRALTPSRDQANSEHLFDPNRAVATLKSLADFRVKARDNVNGGFFTFVNVDGTVGSDRRKGFVTTTRDAWTFARDEDASMQIQSVTLDGAPLTTFSGPTRQVTLAAGQGGKLRVVFGPGA